MSEKINPFGESQKHAPGDDTFPVPGFTESERETIDQILFTEGFIPDPATTRNISLDELIAGWEANKEELVETNLVNRVVKLIDWLGVDPRVIYYPGSHDDHSFADAYPQARTIHADIDEGAISRLRADGYEAYIADMHQFEADEPADVVLTFNSSHLDNEQLKKVTKLGSLVIVNNYYQAATSMIQNHEDFNFVGAMVPGSIEPIPVTTAVTSPTDLPGIEYADTAFVFKRS